VSRVLAARDVNAKGRSIFVTALAAAKERLPRYMHSIKSVFLAKEYTHLCHGPGSRQGTVAALQQIQVFHQIRFFWQKNIGTWGISFLEIVLIKFKIIL
jgi:hypothetical protein